MRFEEESYLIANPDVREAIEKGAFESGRQHYNLFGQSEKRPLHFSETRTGRILHGLDVASMSGIEIGALASPLVLKSQGRIVYVDHATTAELIEKYNGDISISKHKIVQVDAVWGENSLRNAIGGVELYDYVLASHVVEHIPDLLSWFEEIRAVLKPQGKLRLYVPDKRFEFDFLRNESVLADVLDAFVRRTRVPLPRMLLDYHTLVRHVDVVKAWQNEKEHRNEDWLEGCRLGLTLARDTLARGTYHDVHCWVFTPKSFLLLLLQCSELGLLRYRCELFHSTKQFELEFHIGMTPCDDLEECKASWGVMVDQAAEIEEGR